MAIADFLRRLPLALCCLIVLLLVPAPARAADASAFDQASSAYDRGDFPAAKQAYDQLLATQGWNPTLLFNLANTEFRSGALGRAALLYQRTLWIAPTHRQAADNLHITLERSGTPKPPRDWTAPLHSKPARDLATLGTALSLWALLASIAFLLLARTRRTIAASLITLASLVGSATCGILLVHNIREDSIALVTTAQATARLAPADRASIAAQLTAGTPVHILSVRGDWTYCTLPNNSQGWLPSASLEELLPIGAR